MYMIILSQIKISIYHLKYYIHAHKGTIMVCTFTAHTVSYARHPMSIGTYMYMFVPLKSYRSKEQHTVYSW